MEEFEDISTLSLAYFVEVAECGNFTKAAEQLYISQPTLSRQVASLESKLGTALFIREPKRLLLTEAGKLCLKEGREILHSLKLLKKHVTKLSEKQLGYLVIGYTGVYQHGMISAPMREFSSRHPNVDISIRRDDLSQLYEDLLLEKIDIIYTVKNARELAPTLRGVEFLPIKWQVVVPEEHHLASRESVSLGELVKEQLITVDYTESPLSSYRSTELFQMAGFFPTKVKHVPDRDTCVLLVSAGQGVAIALSGSVLTTAQGVKAIDINDIGLDSSMVMIYKEANNNPIIPLYIEAVTRYYSSFQ